MAEQLPVPHVLVLGDFMLDVTRRVRVLGVSHDADNCLTVEETGIVTEAPGGAGNVALACRKLGADVTAHGLVGAGWGAARLRRLLEAAGVKADAHPCAGKTVVRTRVVSDSAHLLRYNKGHCFRSGNAPLPSLVKRCLEERGTPAVTICADYAKGFFYPPVPCALQAAIANNSILFVDPPRGQDWSVFSSPRTIFKPNLTESLAFLDGLMKQEPFPSDALLARGAILRATDPNAFTRDRSDPDKSTCEAYREATVWLRDCMRDANLKFSHLWLTCGRYGSFLMGPDDTSEDDVEHFRCGVQEMVTDATGAGDVAIATAAVSLSKFVGAMSHANEPLTPAAFNGAVSIAASRGTSAATISTRFRGCHHPCWDSIVPS